MRKGFTLIEVMVAVMIITLVIGVLLQLFSNNTRLFSSMRGHSELCMRSSLLIGNTAYGYENEKVTLADLASDFEINDELRKKLKKYKAKITYSAVKELDARKKEIDDIIDPYVSDSDEGLKDRAMEIGRSSFEMDEFQTAYLRLKLQ
jgi:prepilin-type N-terminal cleavage/methylation domain-containing protein